MEMELTEYERTILDYANAAAGRLLILTQSKNEETAIRSCVEVLKLANQIEEMKRAKREAEDAKAAAEEEEEPPMDPEMASEMLEFLANYEERKKAQTAGKIL
jgi:hypothetical protein